MLSSKLRIALRDVIPVDHMNDRRQIIRTAILILEVIGMLPNVDSEQRPPFGHQRAVLIRCCIEDQFFVRVHREPSPAAAENSKRRGSKLLFELLLTSERPIQRLCQFTARLSALRSRSQRLPEQRVIGMTATLISHRSRQRAQAYQQLIDAELR